MMLFTKRCITFLFLCVFPGAFVLYLVSRWLHGVNAPIFFMAILLSIQILGIVGLLAEAYLLYKKLHNLNA